MTIETKDPDSYVQMYYAFAIQLYLGDQYCAVILTGGYFVL